MLQKEFEERIGRSVTQEEYVEANAMYMAAGDGMDKDTFCREWLKIGDSALVKGLFGTAHQNGLLLQELQMQLNEGKELRSDEADSLLEIADAIACGAERDYAAHELVRLAWWLVGQKEVTRRKVDKGYQLDEKDRDVILAAMESRPTEKKAEDIDIKDNNK